MNLLSLSKGLGIFFHNYVKHLGVCDVMQLNMTLYEILPCFKWLIWWSNRMVFIGQKTRRLDI